MPHASLMASWMVLGVVFNSLAIVCWVVGLRSTKRFMMLAVVVMGSSVLGQPLSVVSLSASRVRVAMVSS